ncbi:MAG: hypothetical protein QHH00_05935 [Methanomassiliicoccales archaeon]|jgi:hypothetical protein|nr:hypothetical protein [Methanomassiliicoccales archaeon]
MKDSEKTLDNELIGKRSDPLFILCAGGGPFGLRAAEIGKSYGTVLVVDRDLKCPCAGRADFILDQIHDLDLYSLGKIQFLVGDASGILLELIRLNKPPDFVIPAIRGHFAAKLALEFLVRNGYEVLPNPGLMANVVKRLPDNLCSQADEKSAVLSLSYMSFHEQCDEMCEYPLICPKTGLKREISMYEFISRSLSEVTSSFMVLVTRNFGGLGALTISDIESLLKHLSSLKSGDSFCVATSCECHGIVNFLIVGDQREEMP